MRELLVTDAYVEAIGIPFDKLRAGFDFAWSALRAFHAPLRMTEP